MNVIDKIKTVVPTLNEQQISAITTVKGPVLIIAGPGTGKTLTIVLRTLYLLLSNIAKPEEIIVTTFTEKASFELRDRIFQFARKLGYKENLHLLRLNTIHSMCNNFITKFLQFTPLKKNYQILDELTQVFFIYENFEEIIPVINGKYLDKWETKWKAITEIIPYLNKISEELIEPKRLESVNEKFLQNLALTYKKYKSKLFETNRVDFAHLQKIFFDLLSKKDLYPKIKQNIKYIMVDEYQDTNYIQEQSLLKLASPENNIAVVGDEDQSLYRFRGATVRNILEFPKHFDGKCTQINLTINYRSHKQIINKYNKFITSINWNGFRYPKEIITNPKGVFPKYPAVFCIWGKDKKDEAKRLVDVIKFLKKNKIV